MILENRLIVALDVPNIDKASKLVITLGETVSFYKVGMELFYGAGHEVVNYLKEHGKKVFLDLKLHDIPNTVGNSISVLADLNIDMVNVHASGGRLMMEKAALAARKAEQKSGKAAPKLIAVTVLTSMDENSWQELNNKLTIKEQVTELAKLAKESGLDGVVASPQEAKEIKKVCGKDFLIVTPGIRQAIDSKDDQSRIATPSEAIKAGASHIVVGRPITQANDPIEAVRLIVNDMQGVKK